jgi:hypothetical protein
MGMRDKEAFTIGIGLGLLVQDVIQSKSKEASF